MPELDWQDVLNIGLPKLDDQHKQLIALSNSLIQAMINGMGEEVLDEIFEELREYTVTHFADEEAYMKEIGFPGRDAQKEAHRQLTADVDEFRVRLIDDGSVTPNEALDFINDWMIKHIMEMDSKIGEFVKSFD